MSRLLVTGTASTSGVSRPLVTGTASTSGGGSVSVLLSGTDTYIRAPYWLDDTKDVMRQLATNLDNGTTASNCVDLKGVRLVSSATADMLTAWAAGEVFTNSNDNGPPTRYNNQYLGGGHGLAAVFNLVCAGHGLTNVDVGDVGTISAVSFVLTEIIDANTFRVVANNTSGNSDRWVISASPAASGTITFTAAGAKVYTSRTSVQDWPCIRNHVRAVKLNGSVAVTTGEYAARYVTVEESYDIVNPARWLLLLIAQKGTSSPIPLDDPSVPIQMTIYNTWRFDKYGGMTNTNRVVVSQEASMGTTGSYNYWGGWQYQRISGADCWQYFPDLSGAVGGYDFTNIANVTSNSSTVSIAKSNSINTSDPPSHWAQLTKDGTGGFIRGFAAGYQRTTGQGIPATRAQNTWLYQLSTSEKQYPVAVDGTRFPSARIPVATDLTTVVWECAYKMDSNPTYTVNAAYEYNDKVYRVIDVHASLTNQEIPVPAGLVGRSVTVISTGGTITVHSSTVASNSTVSISTTTWGRAILEIA